MNTNWEEFIKENILRFDVVDGILLITRRAEPIYSTGNLSIVSESCLPQFIKIFNASTRQQDEKLCSKGFVLEDKQGKKNNFVIYHKTFCSVYSTSESNNQGLMVCNLPYGVLLASYPSSQTNTDAIKIVESACKLLRM